jgi:hypothetical protein
MKIEVCVCVMAWIWNKVVGDVIRVNGRVPRREGPCGRNARGRIGD